MRMAFYIGWVLLLGAFAISAAETVAHSQPGGAGWLLSTADLWLAVWPGSFILAENRLGALAPWVWDPVILGLLSLPGWALLGIPGLILTWTCRPNRQLSPAAEEELREHEASLFLYDELAREARKWARDEGDNPNIDDRLPSHDMIDLMDAGFDDDDDNDQKPLPEFVKPPQP